MQVHLKVLLDEVHEIRKLLQLKHTVALLYEVLEAVHAGFALEKLRNLTLWLHLNQLICKLRTVLLN